MTATTPQNTSWQRFPAPPACLLHDHSLSFLPLLEGFPAPVHLQFPTVSSVLVACVAHLNLQAPRHEQSSLDNPQATKLSACGNTGSVGKRSRLASCPCIRGTRQELLGSPDEKAHLDQPKRPRGHEAKSRHPPWTPSGSRSHLPETLRKSQQRWRNS
eukprot:305983-Amphidinium_carterae.1